MLNGISSANRTMAFSAQTLKIKRDNQKPILSAIEEGISESGQNIYFVLEDEKYLTIDFNGHRAEEGGYTEGEKVLDTKLKVENLQAEKSFVEKLAQEQDLEIHGRNESKPKTTLELKQIQLGVSDYLKGIKIHSYNPED
jgi:hypothetical protein